MRSRVHRPGVRAPAREWRARCEDRLQVPRAPAWSSGRRRSGPGDRVRALWPDDPHALPRAQDDVRRDRKPSGNARREGRDAAPEAIRGEVRRERTPCFRPTSTSSFRQGASGRRGPEADEGPPFGRGFTLRDLVLVVWIDQIRTAAVNVDLVAEVTERHRRTLEVPARPPCSVRAGPYGTVRHPAPQGEVERVSPA